MEKGNEEGSDPEAKHLAPLAGETHGNGVVSVSGIVETSWS